MATQVFGRLSSKTLTLTASIYSRSLSTTSSPISFLRRLRPLSGAVITSHLVLLPPSFRSLSTRATIPSLIGPSPNVIMQSTYIDLLRNLFRGEREPTRDEIMDSYVKTLAELVGSEDDARMMVYSGRKIAKDKYAFGTLISGELSHRVEALPRVVMILLGDPFLNIKNIDEIPLPWLEELVRNFVARGDPGELF